MRSRESQVQALKKKKREINNVLQKKKAKIVKVPKNAREAIVFTWGHLSGVLFHEKEKMINMFTQEKKSKLSFLILTCVLYHNRHAGFLFCTYCVFFTRSIVNFNWQLLYYSNVRFLHFFRNKCLIFKENSPKESTLVIPFLVYFLFC